MDEAGQESHSRDPSSYTPCLSFPDQQTSIRASIETGMQSRQS